jgi:multidrug efflux pump subunit AcrA (membrane-fusion protein)
VKVGFTETDAGKVHVGQPATITLDAVPGKTYQGHVLTLDTNQTLVNNVVTYYAKISLEGSSGEAKPGMTASVSIVLDKRDNAVTLPTSAVPTSGTTATLAIRGTNGKDSSRAITIGLRGDNAVEITNGLKEGQQVVVRSSTGGSTGGFQLPGGGGGLGGGGIPGPPG